MKLVRKTEIKAIDRLTLFLGPLIPVFTIPQAYDIWVHQETAGVSLITWLFYLLTSALFAVYGLIHREKLLIITYIPFTVIELFIVIGLLIYR